MGTALFRLGKERLVQFRCQDNLGDNVGVVTNSITDSAWHSCEVVMELLQGSFIVLSFILWGLFSRVWVGESPTNKFISFVCRFMTAVSFILILHLMKVI
jgi:hypothetical protein